MILLDSITIDNSFHKIFHLFNFDQYLQELCFKTLNQFISSYHITNRYEEIFITNLVKKSIPCFDYDHKKQFELFSILFDYSPFDYPYSIHNNLIQICFFFDLSFLASEFSKFFEIEMSYFRIHQSSFLITFGFYAESLSILINSDKIDSFNFFDMNFNKSYVVNSRISSNMDRNHFLNIIIYPSLFNKRYLSQISLTAIPEKFNLQSLNIKLKQFQLNTKKIQLLTTFITIHSAFHHAVGLFSSIPIWDNAAANLICLQDPEIQYQYFFQGMIQESIQNNSFQSLTQLVMSSEELLSKTSYLWTRLYTYCKLNEMLHISREICSFLHLYEEAATIDISLSQQKKTYAEKLLIIEDALKCLNDQKQNYSLTDDGKILFFKTILQRSAYRILDKNHFEFSEKFDIFGSVNNILYVGSIFFEFDQQKKMDALCRLTKVHREQIPLFFFKRICTDKEKVKLFIQKIHNHEGAQSIYLPLLLKCICHTENWDLILSAVFNTLNNPFLQISLLIEYNFLYEAINLIEAHPQLSEYYELIYYKGAQFGDLDLLTVLIPKLSHKKT